MANLIKPPLLDETGKAILAALQGEELAENTGSKIKAPMSDETGKAILEFLQNGGGGGSGGGGAFVIHFHYDAMSGFYSDEVHDEIIAAVENEQSIMLSCESENTKYFLPAEILVYTNNDPAGIDLNVWQYSIGPGSQGGFFNGNQVISFSYDDDGKGIWYIPD